LRAGATEGDGPDGGEGGQAVGDLVEELLVVDVRRSGRCGHGVRMQWSGGAVEPISRGGGSTYRSTVRHLFGETEAPRA
jgi:hypothetical protein